jgi:hypothetical protein
MAAPTFTGGGAGNAKASASLAANTAASTFDVDVSTSFEARLQVGATFGAVAATAGLKIAITELIGSTPVADSVAGPGSQTLAAVTSTSQAVTIHLQTGKWRILLTNTDATNGLTSVYATYDLTPTIA